MGNSAQALKRVATHCNDSQNFEFRFFFILRFPQSEIPKIILHFDGIFDKNRAAWALLSMKIREAYDFRKILCGTAGTSQDQ